MIQIDTANRLILDGQQTGLALVQRASGTVIYTPESKASGTAYREHAMPAARYSTAHESPASGAAGRATLEQHVRALLESLRA
jgi:hypothetical protein